MTIARRRVLLQNLALAAGAVATTALLLEGGLRVRGADPDRAGGTACLHTQDRRTALDCYPTNPRGYFDVDLRDPSTLARFRAAGVKRVESAATRAPYCVAFRYNRLRLRGPEIQPPRDGVRRIAVLGDSFTEGQGVKEDDTYPRVLERLLNAGGGRWEVLNCGRRASDFPELLAEFEGVLQLDPEIVVYGMVPNDCERTPPLQARLASIEDLIEDTGRAAGPRRLGPLDSRLAAFVEERLERRRVTEESLAWYRDLYGEANRAGWASTQANIRAMDGQLRRRGGRLLVATWPLLPTVGAADPLRGMRLTVERFLADTGIAHHDLRGDLAREALASLWVHSLDMHPNEKAHAIAARSLEPVVRRLAYGLSDDKTRLRPVSLAR